MFDVNRKIMHPRERRASQSALLTWYRGGDTIKARIGWAGSMNGYTQNTNVTFWLEDLKGRRHLDTVVNTAHNLTICVENEQLYNLYSSRNSVYVIFMVTTVHHWYQSLYHSTNAHNVKNVELLKHIKIMQAAPTCLGLRRNHHKGATASIDMDVAQTSVLWRHSMARAACVLCTVQAYTVNSIRLQSAQHTRRTGHTMPS